MLSRLQKTNKLHTMRMIFVIAIATATCDCNEDSYALLVSFDNWPEDVTKYLEQEQIDDKYKKESESWYDIPYSSIISRGQSAKIKFEARDGLGCTAADHEATIEIPFWPRQWVRVKVPWNKLAYPQCPPEWPSQMLTWDNPKLGNGLSPALGGTGDDDIWMVDSTGAAWHFDGQTWKNTIPNAAYGLTGIWSASRTNVWATSISGAIFHWNGESWTARQSFDKSIRQIFGVNSGNIYAVGVRGFMAHWDGISWTEIRPETTNDLNAIWGRSDAEVWAGGAKGTILHYDGKSWKKKEIPLPEPKMGIITKDIYSIWGPPATKQNPQPAEVWLVGDMGTRIRWNGSEFEHWRKGDISMPQLRVVRGFATQDNFADPSYVWISGSANRIEQSDFAGGKWKDFPIDATLVPVSRAFLLLAAPMRGLLAIMVDCSTGTRRRGTQSIPGIKTHSMPCGLIRIMAFGLGEAKGALLEAIERGRRRMPRFLQQFFIERILVGPRSFRVPLQWEENVSQEDGLAVMGKCGLLVGGTPIPQSAGSPEYTTIKTHLQDGLAKKFLSHIIHVNMNNCHQFGHQKI